MADKGDVYYCCWQREADGTCTGWELRHPMLRATAFSPDELMQELGEIVGEYYDDHEAALHFDPSLVESGDPAWFADGYMEIGWNALFKFRPSASTAYSNGRCNRCGGGLGPRTTAPVEVDEITDLTDGASSPQSNQPPPCDGMPGRLMIVSKEFLKLLGVEEHKTFEARPVKWAKTSRGRFFELVPRALVPLGTIKGLDVTGRRCDRCNRRDCSNASALGYCVGVVCRQNLPLHQPGFFFAGSETDVHLYCTRARWLSLAGKDGTRKLTGGRLAVVDVSQFETDPLLGTLDEIANFRREHGFKAVFKPQPRT